MTTTVVTFVIRQRSLWCYSCMLPCRVEGDVINNGEIVATMTGCPDCETGIYTREVDR